MYKTKGFLSTHANIWDPLLAVSLSKRYVNAMVGKNHILKVSLRKKPSESIAKMEKSSKIMVVIVEMFRATIHIICSVEAHTSACDP